MSEAQCLGDPVFAIYKKRVSANIIRLELDVSEERVNI